MYECGLLRLGPRTMTPRVVLEVHGIASRVAHGHRDEGVKTIGLDRLQWSWLA
jgi:hypothetical protein